MPGGNTNNIRVFSILRGGVGIHNPNADPSSPGGAYGTLGLIVTSDGNDRWILSCYHVLCRKHADMPAVTEPVFHPFSQLQPAPVAVISQDRMNRGLDCAAARLLNPLACVGQVLGIGRLTNPRDPELGMRVIKSGAETGVTEGIIVNVTESEVEIAPLGYPPRYELSEGGDSGAVYIDAKTYAPVALHYRGNDDGMPERAFGKRLLPILAALNLQVVIE